jgi:single-stranded DNA-binding protein
MSAIECAFIGVLGRDAEHKVSKAGKDYLRLNVRAGDGDGAQWVTVMVFDPEVLAQAARLVKGVKVYIEASGLKVDTWTGADGAQRHGLSCMVGSSRSVTTGHVGSARAPSSLSITTRLEVGDEALARVPR